MNEVIKLNLGSGDFPLEGYRNLDHKNGAEVYPLPRFFDNTVDEVRASHVLEHFPHGQIESVVKEWARVLKPGGKLKIAVPDFDWIIKAYQNGHRDDPRLEHYLFGGQQDGDDFHKAFFNEGKLAKLLEGVGLTDVKRWAPDADDCSSYHVSLNLEGTKPGEVHYLPTPTYEFIKHSKGVIHIGANTGQARDIYAKAGLPVIWIEAIPAVYQQLERNIAGYPLQLAYNYLLTDKGGEWYDFKVSNNDGQSSSIYEFGEHTKIWPDIHYTGSIQLRSRTLKSVIEERAIDLSLYDTLILDTQGSELLVLKGAWELIDKFRFIRCEAADFELYKGGCLLKDLDEHLTPRGFERVQTWHYKRSPQPEVSRIYEALYQKKIAPPAQPKQTIKCPPLTPIYIEDDKTGSKALYRIAVATTVPRLGFQAHAQVLERAFAEPRIPILRTGGAFWEMGIQNAINSLIKLRADYVVVVDYDSIFNNDDVKELLKLAVRYPEADAIAGWQPSRWRKDTALAGVLKNGQWGGTVSVEEMKRTDLTPVDNTVFGLTLIKTSAILKMKKPWFLNTPNADGDWLEGKHDADSYFWHKFREAGNTIYMANRVRIGHLHEGILWVDDDFNFTKQDLQEWYLSGRPF